MLTPGFGKQSIGLILPSCNTFELLMESLKTNLKWYRRTGDFTFFIPHVLLPLQNLEPTLPTMLSHWLTSPEAIHQIPCTFLWSHKGLTTILTYSVNTCEHTLLHKIGGVPLWAHYHHTCCTNQMNFILHIQILQASNLFHVTKDNEGHCFPFNMDIM